MIDATVGILTLNSARNLHKCLNSLIHFREKIILDGGSLDSTLEIAKKFNCKIIKQKKSYKFPNKRIKNFAEARNVILKEAKYGLILMLDSDETLHQRNLSRINFLSKSAISKNKYYGFLIPRVPAIKNSIYKKTNLFPNFQLRLIYKFNVKRYIKDVHEKPIPVNDKLKELKLEKNYINFSAELTNIQIKKKFDYYLLIEKSMIAKDFFNALHFIFNGLLALYKMFFKILLYKKSNKEILIF